MYIPPKQIKQFQKKILSWYQENKRDLPWRRTKDPYKILVSEVMLQQTQVARVLPKYEAWIAAIPTIERLAQAKTSEVLRLWSGLGYNRRSLYLQKTAQAVAENYNGIFPKDSTILKRLPGIGEYTAAAVACFAFGQQVAVVDTNVRKVILTQFSSASRRTNVQFSKKQIQEIAHVILPAGRAYEWNQALMDYASAMLKKEKIPIPKQSKFQGSNRYYRGQIIKLVLERGEVTLSALMTHFQKDAVFIARIVQGLEKDGLLKEEKNKILIASS